MRRIYLLLLLLSFLGCFTIKGQKCVNLYKRGIPSKIVSIHKSKTTESNIGIVRGTILNREDTLAVNNVDIIVGGKNFAKVLKTDINGYFEIELQNGIYDFCFPKIPTFNKSLEINNSEVIELEIHLGEESSWVYFETDNPKELKKSIRKENRRRKRLYR